MKRIHGRLPPLVFHNYDGQDGGGEVLEISYTNRGDPYAEGIELDFRDDGPYNRRLIGLMLSSSDVVELRDYLIEVCKDNKWS